MLLGTNGTNVADTTHAIENRQTHSFKQKLESYDQWKEQIRQSIHSFQTWLSDSNLVRPHTQQHLTALLQTLLNDQIIVVFTGEFSRGKSELINAIFFADYNRRLLPSCVGRTTMCPTELFYDREHNKSYLKLLPIETRLETKNLKELREIEEVWHTLELEICSPEQMAQAFEQVTHTQWVSREKAKELGFIDDSPSSPNHETDQIEIPLWRHGLISFPHPLLKKGLVIIDTPGLNALGTEPELTLGLFPSAQAALFLLAADAGVSQSDLAIWQELTAAFENSDTRTTAVILNKIDTLQDDLTPLGELNRNLQTQCETVAQTLDVSTEQIFPISAKQGLIAKIREDSAQLEQSRLLELEDYLSYELFSRRQTILKEQIVSDINALAIRERAGLKALQQQFNHELTQLASQHGKNSDIVEHLTQSLSERIDKHTACLTTKENHFQRLNEHIQAMTSILDIKRIDTSIEATKTEMSQSWTTINLIRGMRFLFEGFHQLIEEWDKQTEQLHDMYEAALNDFKDNHQVASLAPVPPKLNSYSSRFNQLYAQNQKTLASSTTILSEQRYVIRRYFFGLVSETRQLFIDTTKALENWLEGAFYPIEEHLEIQNQLIQQQQDSLNRIATSNETLQTKANYLLQRCKGIDNQLLALEDIREGLTDH